MSQKFSPRKTPLASAISCALIASSLGISAQALAQAEQEEDSGLDADAVEEIVVVGSRIKKTIFTSSAPIDIILTEAAAARGTVDLGQLMQTTTIAAGSPQVTAAQSSYFNANGGTGAQTVDLRGLGATRTLTLLNGRRIGPAGTQGAVSSFDFNILPLAAVERIEILKDGASSIYGSDAVAGVINIITKKEDGGTIEAYRSQPSESGGELTRISGSWGKTFSRGNLRLTADYYKMDELKNGDRAYFACGEQYVFDPDTGERADIMDPRTGQPRCTDPNGGIWGHVWIYDYSGDIPAGTKAQYDYDGDLAQYIPGFPFTSGFPGTMNTPPGWFPVAYDRQSDGLTSFDHPFQDQTSLNPEIERITFFADGELDLTDHHAAYMEVLLNRRETALNGYRQYWGYIYNETFFATNPLSAGWTGDQWLSPTPITDHADSFISVDYQRFVVGFRGDITGSWSYDLSFQYSKSDGDYTNDQIYEDSIIDQNWLDGSCVGMTTSVRGVPCIDIPWLDPAFMAGEVSPDMREFLFGVDTGNTIYKQKSVEGFVTGELWDLPAGPVSAAFGIHYREDEINDTPGSITLAGNGWGSSMAGITAGDDTTKAVFAEIDIPIISDKPGFENLTVNVSTRYTDVDSYGSDDTYKVGINWQILPSLRIRANRGTSFRTPALFELYLADQTGYEWQRAIDPCINWGTELDAGNISQRIADNCATTTTPDYPTGLPDDFTGGSITATVFSGGGLGTLEAERSISKNIGIIWQPGFTDLSISIDHFDFEVNDQVDQIGAAGIVYGCYDSEFYPTDPLCNLFDRTMLNSGIDNVRDKFINVAIQTNKGWDVAAVWRTPLYGGELTVDTQHTFQDEAITALFEDTVRDENGQFGEPEWVGRLWLTYDRGDWSYFYGANFVGDVSNYESFGGDTATLRGDTVRVVLDADAVTYHSASVTRYFDDMGLQVVAGITNLTDEQPPRITTLGLGELHTQQAFTAYTQYDIFGRTYFLNLSMDFDK